MKIEEYLSYDEADRQYEDLMMIKLLLKLLR